MEASKKEVERKVPSDTASAKAALKAAKAEVATAKTAVKKAVSAEDKTAAAAALEAAQDKLKAATAALREAEALKEKLREQGEMEPKPVQTSAKPARTVDPLEALAAKYAKAYPDCKAFHITSDRQVFLDKDKNLALYHQRGLGGGEVRTINVR